MEIRFINHASFMIESNEIRLVCDPWIEGTAFDNGWLQLAETKFRYDEFKDVTHIWFSHEHPDHFSPPNLAKISKEDRAKITVLFQATSDRKVSDFCRKLGFKEIVELKEDVPFHLNHDFSIICNAYTEGDSYAMFLVEGRRILNLNDCIVNSIHAAQGIRAKIGEVDWLFTQFGYANKIGNLNDVDLRVKASKEKLNRINLQCQVFQPSVVLPFASFVYFCHEDNVYLNEGVNDIADVFRYINEETSAVCVILYPNDRWNGQLEWDSLSAIQMYTEDSKEKIGKKLLRSVKIEKSLLVENSKKFVEQLKKGYPRKKSLIGKMNARIFLTDYREIVLLTGYEGIKFLSSEEHNWDLALSSDALNYCFKELWGGETLRINGRFQTGEHYNKFRQFSDIASCLNRKEAFPYSSLFDRIMRKILKPFVKN
jgi:UDP-MurNAc hydroxylase